MNTFVARPLFEPPSEDLRFLPECPRVLRNYPGAGPVLAWVAIQHGAGSHEGSLNLLDLSSRSNRNIPLPGRPGFFVETDRPGVLLVGLERRLVLVDLASGEVTGTPVALREDDRVIINDGIAIPGGVIFGTKHLAFSDPIAALYYYDCESRQLRELVGGQYCSNGKFYREGTLIDIDSMPKSITRYRFDAGFTRVLERSLIVDPASLTAFPDGLRPTADGASIVVAFYNPACVSDGLAQELRLSDGAVLSEWTFPGSPRVTCPEFAMLDGKVRLLFTTAVEGMPPETRALAPHAGAIYVADTPFVEMPEAPPLVKWR